MCHQSCSDEGCWGKGANKCLNCRSYKIDNSSNICIDHCKQVPMMYDAGNRLCAFCHEECKEDCVGAVSMNRSWNNTWWWCVVPCQYINTIPLISRETSLYLHEKLWYIFCKLSRFVNFLVPRSCTVPSACVTNSMVELRHIVFNSTCCMCYKQ